MDSSPGRNGSPEPVNTPFNSIEWIPTTLAPSVDSMNAYSFNSIEWIRSLWCMFWFLGCVLLSIPLNGFNEALRDILCHNRSKLSIPLNGFHVTDVGGTNPVLNVYSFNSIEWIQGKRLHRSYCLCYFQFHWMDSVRYAQLLRLGVTVRLSIPLNGFRHRSRLHCLGGSYDLSIPLNGFYEYLTSAHDILFSKLSIPLNGFDALPLSWALTSTNQAFNSIEWIPCWKALTGIHRSWSFNSIVWIPL